MSFSTSIKQPGYYKKAEIRRVLSIYYSFSESEVSVEILIVARRCDVLPEKILLCAVYVCSSWKIIFTIIIC